MNDEFGIWILEFGLGGDRPMAKFADLDSKRQEWLVGHHYILAIAIKLLSQKIEQSIEQWTEVLNDVADEYLEKLPSEALEQRIAAFDFDIDNDFEIEQ